MIVFSFFFFNYPATTEIYTLSLHDALPICTSSLSRAPLAIQRFNQMRASQPHRTVRSIFIASSRKRRRARVLKNRSEEHTSELQSRVDLVCRLLLEKKKK